MFMFTNAFALDDKQEIVVAVSANFSPTLDKIITHFHEKNPTIKVKEVSSSSGSIYRQIVQGAPYNIFLAADELYIQKLVEQNLVATNNHFSYAEGILALCSRTENISNLNISQINSLLKNSDHIAIGDPTFAPYGIAAKQFLNSAAIYKDVEPKLVFTKDVAQVMNYLDTQAVSFGFVPLSLAKLSTTTACSQQNTWLVPTKNYTPIIQDAALTKNSEKNKYAQLFYNYLKSEDVKKIIADSNYKTL